MPDTFRTPYDICNRAAFHLGARPITSFTDGSPNGTIFGANYDKIRLAELQRNTWTFATRRAILRPVSATTVIFTPPTYSSTTLYQIGDIVLDSSGYPWVSKIANNVGNAPGTIAYPYPWDTFFGPLWIDFWGAFPGATANSGAPNVSYSAGELAYMSPNNQIQANFDTPPTTTAVYQSLVNNNTNQPNVVDQWQSTDPTNQTLAVMYNIGDVVQYGGVNYQSLVALNYGFEPDISPTQWTTTITSPLVSRSWRQVAGATIVAPVIHWPTNVGPVEEPSTRNMYRLPAGYLQEAPQDPKAGNIPYLGAGARSLPPNDWEKDGEFIVTAQFGPIAYRFVADVQDVSTMGALFCEGLAARCGWELCEEITQATDKRAAMKDTYNALVFEARGKNAIEQGPIELEQDTYVTVRR